MASQEGLCLLLLASDCFSTQALPVSSSDGAATVTLPAESFAVLSSEASAVFEAAVATALEAAGKRHEVRASWTAHL